MAFPGGKWAMQEQCKRCGLCYFSKHHDKCPHCSELDESELSMFIELKQRESEGAVRLGRAMLISAALLVLLIVFAMNNI